MFCDIKNPDGTPFEKDGKKLINKKTLDGFMRFAMDEAKKLGNSRVFNTIIIGVAAKNMDFDKQQWLDVIANTVPPKTVEINQKAFEVGFEK